MTTLSQVAYLQSVIDKSSDPKEVARCKRNIAYLTKGSSTVSAPVAQHSMSTGKASFYAYLGSSVAFKAWPSEKGAFNVYTYRSVMAILPFTLVAPGTMGATVSEDLGTITFRDELGTPMDLHTDTLFILSFLNKNPANENGGWHLLRGVSMPKINKKKKQSPYRNNGLPWVQLQADGAEFWEDGPTHAQTYDLFSRFHGSVRNRSIVPFPRKMLPDMQAILSIAETYKKKAAVTMVTGGPASSSSAETSSAVADDDDSIAAAALPTDGAASTTAVASTRPGIEALEFGARAVFDQMLIERPGLFSPESDPKRLFDLIFNSRQVIVPLQPPAVEMILDNPNQFFTSGVANFFGIQCLTSEDKPKKIEVSPDNPFGYQAAARFGVNTVCDGEDGTSAHIVVTAFLANALKFFSKIMGLYAGDSVLYLATTPVRHPVYGEIPRVAAFPAVAIGPIGHYRTARANADLPEPEPDAEETESFLDFTPFDSAADTITGIFSSCIIIDYATFRRLMISICVNAGLSKAVADDPQGVSVAGIVNKFKADTNRYRKLHTTCVIHERTGNAVFSPSQSSVLFSSLEADIGINKYEKVSETNAENFFFLIMANIVFTDAQQELDYRAMINEYLSLPLESSRKASLLKKINDLSKIHGAEVMKAKDPSDGSSVFNLHDATPFFFELFAINREVACPLKRKEVTTFTNPSFSEEEFKKARDAVVAYNCKRISSSIKTTVDADELAFLEQAESKAPSPSSSSKPEDEPVKTKVSMNELAAAVVSTAAHIKKAASKMESFKKAKVPTAKSKRPRQDEEEMVATDEDGDLSDNPTFEEAADALYADMDKSTAPSKAKKARSRTSGSSSSKK